MRIIKSKREKVLILGANGMLGNAVLRIFAASPKYDTIGTVRSIAGIQKFPINLRSYITTGVDAENFDSLMRVFTTVRPDIVINCIGLVKQLAIVDDPLIAIPINALFPHRLARLCEVTKARLVHIGTDCVFSGRKGMYKESDPADATDLYGRSKYLGEVEYSNTITLRTSIIGHELESSRSLIGWFLAQSGAVNGYRRAIFSGLPTVEIAMIIRDYVIPHRELSGLYHLSTEPINKYELLKLVSEIYSKNIEILADDSIVINRSLDSTRFKKATGYAPSSWPELIKKMCEFNDSSLPTGGQ